MIFLPGDRKMTYRCQNVRRQLYQTLVREVRVRAHIHGLLVPQENDHRHADCHLIFFVYMFMRSLCFFAVLFLPALECCIIYPLRPFFPGSIFLHLLPRVSPPQRATFHFIFALSSFVTTYNDLQ